MWGKQRDQPAGSKTESPLFITDVDSAALCEANRIRQLLIASSISAMS